ncbi:MAG: hypothetical protein GVY13_19825, partial [Alphaproteobacteria bacterium]|nr:hypothetical protein [Alphaproteobacteria bacterium]
MGNAGGLRLGLWGGLAVLLGLAGWLMLSACGLSWPGGGQPWLSFCAEPQAADPRGSVLEAERARQRLLEERLDRLRLALVAAPACPRPQPPPQLAEGPPQPMPDP